MIELPVVLWRSGDLPICSLPVAVRAIGKTMPTSGPTGDAGADDRRLTRLMVAAQAGDRGAYRLLLGQCIPIIARTARQYRVPPDRVDDVVQETLITIHHARHTFDPDRSFSAWLRTLAHRRAIDLIRRETRIRQREVYAPMAYENHADINEHLGGDLAYLGASGQLPQLVKVLPPRQREAVEQLAFKQQTLSEAAAATGRSAGALKVSFHRALTALRAVLAPKDRG